MTIFTGLPNNIQDGDLETAVAVMANFNQLFTDGNTNAATAGANGNITSLTGLTTPLSVAQGGTGTTTGAASVDGQCRLTYVGTTSIALIPFGGNKLAINGTTQTIPTGGITCSPTGGLIGGGNTTNLTLYYVYAYMVGATMTLGMSTTGYTYSSTGIAQMTGNTLYRLVGMIYTVGGSAPGNFSGNTGVIQDSSTPYLVYSYFNRRQVGNTVYQTTQATSASSTLANLFTGLPFLVWGDEYVTAGYDGVYAQAQSGGTPFATFNLYMDAVTTGNDTLIISVNAPAIAASAGVTTTGGVYIGRTTQLVLAEGLHTPSFWGSNSSAGSMYTRVNMNVSTRG